MAASGIPAVPRVVARGGATRAVFFDLDGTLADTSGDLAAPLNAIRAARGLDAMPLASLRPFVSQGTRGMLRAGLGIEPGHPEFEGLKDDFLARYEAALCVHTRLFDGMPAVLEALERAGIAWGVVSNKAERFVRPVVDGLGLSQRTACAIGGDTTAHAKPHPEPLLHAARLAGVEPSACVYVGDDLRDVQAAHAAGMPCIAVAWGFLGDGDPIGAWGADAIADDAAMLAALLGV